MQPNLRPRDRIGSLGRLEITKVFIMCALCYYGSFRRFELAPGENHKTHKTVRDSTQVVGEEPLESDSTSRGFGRSKGTPGCRSATDRCS